MLPISVLRVKWVSGIGRIRENYNPTTTDASHRFEYRSNNNKPTMINVVSPISIYIAIRTHTHTAAHNTIALDFN